MTEQEHPDSPKEPPSLAPPPLLSQPAAAVGYAAGGGPTGTATASMVLGIISIPVCILYGLPSLVLGILAIVFARSAKKKIRRGEMSPSGEGKATAGFVCGIIGTCLGAIGAALIAAPLVLLFWMKPRITAAFPAPATVGVSTTVPATMPAGAGFHFETGPGGEVIVVPDELSAPPEELP